MTMLPKITREELFHMNTNQLYSIQSEAQKICDDINKELLLRGER